SCDNGTTNGNPDPLCDTGTVNVTVTEVNDAPVAVTDTPTTPEDTAKTIDAAANDSPGPANESTQTLHVASVGTPSHGTASVIASGPDAGSVLYTPAADYNGSDSFTYQVCDNGTTNGNPDPLCDTGTVNVTVTAVNDAPSFTKGADKTVLEDAGAQSVSNWATAISAGPPNEASQTVNFIVSNNNNALFTSGGQPAISA